MSCWKTRTRFALSLKYADVLYKVKLHLGQNQTLKPHYQVQVAAADALIHLIVTKFFRDLDILRPSMERWPVCRK